MTDDLPEKVRWDADFKRRVYGTVVGGLILLAITAAGGLLFTQVGSLSAREAFLYVGVPMVGVVSITVSGFVGRALVQRARARAEWEADVGHLLTESMCVIRRMLLADLIHTARVREWEVFEDIDGDLVFHSPDDDVVVVDERYPSVDDVATRLHLAAPFHFSDDWHDFTYSANVTADLAELGLRQVGERLAAIEVNVAKAALATIVPVAERAGWQVSWHEDHVRFERDDRAATVAYDSIDAIRLREVLGL